MQLCQCSFKSSGQFTQDIEVEVLGSLLTTTNMLSVGDGGNCQFKRRLVRLQY